MIKPITFPARPVNGGHLKYALPKVGDWFYEPKYNGWRALIHAPSRTMFNRRGELLTIADEFKDAFDMLAMLASVGIEWADCESLERRHNIARGSLILLDVVVPELTYVQRRDIMLRLPFKTFVETVIPDIRNTVFITPSYKLTASELAEFWDSLQAQNKHVGCDFYEGFVAKRSNSTYPIQLNSPDHTTGAWMKHRFIK